MPPPPEKRGFRLYREVLKDPKHVVAPMVDASELAWRMLGMVNTLVDFQGSLVDFQASRLRIK